MEEALSQLLLGDVGVVAFAGDRVNWNERVQASALPAITLSKVSSQAAYTMSGVVNYSQDRVQADVWASGFLQSLDGSRAVAAALDGLRAERDGIQFLGVFLAGERQSTEEATGGERVHRVSLDFMIHYRRTGQ